MDYLQTLINLINSDLEVDERKFPYSDEVYIYTLLRDKFPEENLTMNTVLQILAEELALENIKIKEEDSEAHPMLRFLRV